MKPFTSLLKWCVGLLVLVGSLWSVPALGAEPYVEGVVRDTLGAGIPYATVSLLPESAETGAVEDGAVVIGSITDESGRYRIDGVAAGHYRLVCDHLSFVSQQRSVVVRSGRNEHDFRLVPAAEAIEEVEVIGTAMQYEAGKYSIRLAESSITENKTVEETLKMLPGLSVVDDQVRLDGRPVALIYIDDREVFDMQELKSLKGEYIESIEVQNQTGSAYSATKQGGIVRIKLKKNAERSDFGNVMLDSFVSMARGKDKPTYIGTLKAPIFIQRGPLYFYNLIVAGWYDMNTASQDETDYRTAGYRLNSRVDGHSSYGTLYDVFSLIYDLNERSDIGVTGVALFGNAQNKSTTHSIPEALAGSETVQLPGYDSSDYAQQKKQLNQGYLVGLNYNLRLDTLGSKLVAKAEYNYGLTKENEWYDTKWQTAGAAIWEDRYRQDRDVISHALASRLDFTKVFRAGRAIDVGATYSMSHVDELWHTEQWTGEAWIPDPDQSRSFLNRNHEATAYAIYRDMYGKFSYSLGANLQWDRISYEKAGGALTARDYIQPFGNISVSYTINPQRGTNINLDVSRYISSLPNSSQLSTYEERVSENVYYVGNENLKLPTGYRAQLTYTLLGAWRFSYSFGLQKDGIYNLSWVDPDRPEVVWQSPVNGTRAYSHVVAVSWNQSVTDWLRCNVSWDGSWSRDWYGEYNSEAFRYYLYANLLFQLPQKATINVWGAYESGSQWIGGGISDALLCGVSADKKFGERFTIRLSATFRMWNRVMTSYQLDGSYAMSSTVLSAPLEGLQLTLSYDFLNRNPKPIRKVETMLDNAW